MKIFNNPNIQKALGTYKSKVTKPQKINKVGASKDKIEISSKAREFQVALNAFKKLPEIRKEKVEEINNAITSGTYNPSAEEIVSKMSEKVRFDKKI
ncbi:flagellar biosynthesis anti-sigma factor FlgM [Maledivibacter halophilus]|uniref:Negative regulator of flagellin synthesis n=1 Tax=Maledivibacter halophilus TaxID=36842 RepID=A0A1T5JWX6_9FIRM|nr:flagellar biosynthesis anti-sigma factor FlgM [Maledivibacter halophilus]SKC55921.1 anti-sigma-28 factor, FlgM family [Maledivibacter halophilus]